jgi:hypothetical protein
MNKQVLHIVWAFVLSGLLLLLTDPFMFWMPDQLALTVLFVAVVLLGAWMGFVMKEKARDEREVQHIMNSGRIAYLAGFVVLTMGLAIQGFVGHHVDPWIAGTLGVMIVAKLISQIYFEHYK